MKRRVVVTVRLDDSRIEYALEVSHVGVVFRVWVNWIVLDDQAELIDLQVECFSNLAAQVTNRLEERHRDLGLNFVVHVQAVRYRDHRWL